MKIEKMNDHQIRCTLTSEDLATRNIKLSELAYGSEKTRALFRDMMQQAAMDFGFEAEDIPLMVEAIPLSSEKIVVIITKVESPDELDTPRKMNQTTVFRLIWMPIPLIHPRLMTLQRSFCSFCSV